MFILWIPVPSTKLRTGFAGMTFNYDDIRNTHDAIRVPSHGDFFEKLRNKPAIRRGGGIMNYELDYELYVVHSSNVEYRIKNGGKLKISE